MGIDLLWDDDEQTVVLAEFKGEWTWDDLHTMLNTVKRLSQERKRVLGAIIDVRSGLQLPGGSVLNRAGLENFRKLLSLSDDGQRGPVVVLGMNRMVRSLLDAMTTLDKSLMLDVSFADTIEEAQQQIYPAVARLNDE